MVFTISVSIGMIFGIIECYVVEVKKVRSFLSRPLLFISGVFFSLQDIPREYWYLVDWNPLLHGIELSRFALYSTYTDIGVSVTYLAKVTLYSLFLSLIVYVGFWRQAISR
jgi:capsular polysaccharide transport system permease protein